MADGWGSPVGGALVGGSAPVLFTPGSPSAQVDSSIVVEWDLDNDGDFDEPEEDITSLVMSAEVVMGRDFPSSLTARAAPAQIRLTVNNDDDRFSYFNESSPLNTDPFTLNVGRKLRIRTTDAGAASTISYVGAGALSSAANATGSGFVFGLIPAGVQEGDLLLIWASIRNSGTGVVQAPPGWAVVPDENGFPLSHGNCALLGRYYDADTTTPTINFVGGVANATIMAQCFAFRGTHKRLAEVISVSATQLNSSAQNIAVPALTMTEDNLACIVLGWKQDDWTSVNTLAGQFFTEISEASTTSGDDAGHAIQYRIQGAAFNFVATSLAVTGGGAAISRGWTIAIRPDPGLADPMILARDRFQKDDLVNLGNAETGQVWEDTLNSGFAVVTHMAKMPETLEAGTYGTDIVATVEVDQSDHYVQAAISTKPQAAFAGVVARCIDGDNFVTLAASDDVLFLVEYISGTDSVLGTYALETWDGMHVGLHVKDNVAVAYVGGVEVLRRNLSGLLGGTRAGLFAWYGDNADRRPALDDFHVWDKMATDIPGVICTGYVNDVKGGVRAGQAKIVQVEAMGPLSQIPATYVPAPRIPSDLVPPGMMVGDILARTGLLHPPATIDPGTRRFGPFGLMDNTASELAREVELAELGLIYETPEGHIGFKDYEGRITSSNYAWFTDTTGVGQLGYHAIDPLNHRPQIYNRVSARVAPSKPVVTRNAPLDSGFSGYQSDIEVTFTATEPGDLIIAFLVTSMWPMVNWENPEGWTSHRDAGSGLGMRIYSHICDDNLDGQSVTFLLNAISAAGFWFARVYRFQNWLGTSSGYAVGDVMRGTNAKTLEHGWGREPSAFVWFQAAIKADTGGVVIDTTGRPPPTYSVDNYGGVVGVGPPDEIECGYVDSWKYDCSERENAGPSSMITNYQIRESVVVAVRGFDGDQARTNLTTNETLFDAQTFTVEDPMSQVKHNFTRTNPHIPYMLYRKGDALEWAEDVLAEKSDDQPIFTLSFFPSRSALHRRQALERRLSDKVTVTATGNAGLGFEREFWIESVNHRWSHGTKLWETSWQLQPVSEP